MRCLPRSIPVWPKNYSSEHKAVEISLTLDTKRFQVLLKENIPGGWVPKSWAYALSPLHRLQEASPWLSLSLRWEELKDFYTTPRIPPDLGNNNVTLLLNNTLVVFLHPNPMRLSAKEHGGWSGYNASDLFLRLQPSPPRSSAASLDFGPDLCFNDWAVPVSLLGTGTPSLDGSSLARRWTEHLARHCLVRHPPPPFSDSLTSPHDKGYACSLQRKNKGKQNQENKIHLYSLTRRYLIYIPTWNYNVLCIIPPCTCCKSTTFFVISNKG